MQATCNSYNMDSRDRPDMYIWPRAAASRAEGTHIRQVISTYVTCNMYHFRLSKNHPYLQFAALAICYNKGYSLGY